MARVRSRSDDAMKLDVPLLEVSYRTLRAKSRQLVRRFFAQLFEAEPELRALFPEDLEEHGRRFAGALAAILGSLRHPEKFEKYLEELGRRHHGYGVRPEHYGPFGRAFLDAVREVAGPTAWSTDLDRAWSNAWEFARQLMLRGAEGATAP